MLDIRNLHASVSGTPILKGISLAVNAGEIHAVMGPNGSGKSTLAQVLAGHPAYEVTKGEVLYDGKNLLEMAPEERAQAGVFLAFQYPIEIPGVSNAYFLRAAYNELRKARGQEEIDPLEFLDLMEQRLKLVDMAPDMLNRSVNAGFSGGEKKRNEILQMAVLEPKLAILDETDSGLDIDALRVVADGVNALRRPSNATIVVTHYQRLLNYIVPDYVHVLVSGRIAKSGGKDLALELEERGYDWILGGSRVTQPFQADFERFAAGEGRTASPARRALRERAFRRFQSLGFPTQKNEDWHFTSVAPIVEAEFAVQTGAPRSRVGARALDPLLFHGDAAWPTFVFVDGQLDATLSRTISLPDGVRLTELGAASGEDEGVVQRYLGTIADMEQAAFTALNTAFAQGGVLIQVGREAVGDVPIHLVFLATAAAAGHAMMPRVLIVAERNSRLAVIESYGATADVRYFTNAVTEVHLARGAQVDHYRVQREAAQAFHVGTVQAHQEGASRFKSFSFATGAALSRVNVYTSLDGEGSEAWLDGLYMTADTQHMDHQTSIEHAQPNCNSREIYKGILDGASHAVFNGKVYVHPVAQKTDGKQTNNNLLLSDEAHVDTKPQLEIFADDVKCTHGATVGRLDEQALFYMKSRGITSTLARELLTYAFAADVLERIDVEPLRTGLESLTLTRFTRVPATV